MKSTMQKVTTAMPPALLEAIDARAVRLGQDRAETVRALLDLGLAAESMHRLAEQVADKLAHGLPAAASLEALQRRPDPGPLLADLLTKIGPLATAMAAMDTLTVAVADVLPMRLQRLAGDIGSLRGEIKSFRRAAGFGPDSTEEG